MNRLANVPCQSRINRTKGYFFNTSRLGVFYIRLEDFLGLNCCQLCFSHWVWQCHNAYMLVFKWNLKLCHLLFFVFFTCITICIGVSYLMGMTDFHPAWALQNIIITNLRYIWKNCWDLIFALSKSQVFILQCLMF